MRVAIMQPYFFPYLGQFQLINAVERFILCDDVQYIRHGWINRNRVLKQDNEIQYIVIPLAKHNSSEVIRNIRIVEGDGWKATILHQLEHYRKKAPYYKTVNDLLRCCFSKQERNITKLNGCCMQAVCDYLDIPFKIEITSELNLCYSTVRATEDWALTICSQVGATEYYNPHGGMALYDKAQFAQHNIRLNFVKPQLNSYNQCTAEFQPGLSMLDVMMFNDTGAIKSMLNDYELL